MAKWIDFRERVNNGRQTKVWSVVNRDQHAELGFVKWDTGWRRYVFAPASYCIFEQDCLRDIAAFVETETRKHNEARAKEKALEAAK